jgi:hypothetical protein
MQISQYQDPFTQISLDLSHFSDQDLQKKRAVEE